MYSTPLHLGEITVKNIKPQYQKESNISAAFSGDQVLEWNGKLLQGATFKEVYNIILESKPEPQVELVVSRPLGWERRLDRNCSVRLWLECFLIPVNVMWRSRTGSRPSLFLISLWHWWSEHHHTAEWTSPPMFWKWVIVGKNSSSLHFVNSYMWAALCCCGSCWINED